MSEFLLSIVLGIASAQADEASCTSSSQCFSHEYCHREKGCVDAAKEPCRSSVDCVAGELCRFEETPYKCG